MNLGPTTAEMEVVDAIFDFGRAALDRTAGHEARQGDPAATSMMLFTRLWSNASAYRTLWNKHHFLESDIILRAVIEGAICISANAVLREDFYPLLIDDLKASIAKQIKRWRAIDAMDLVREGEAQLRHYNARYPGKGGTFNWAELAKLGGQDEFYLYHQQLSTVSSHVTAMSLMRGVVAVDGEQADAHHRRLATIERQVHPMMLAGSLLVGARLHSEILGFADLAQRGLDLNGRLNQASAARPFPASPR